MKIIDLDQDLRSKSLPFQDSSLEELFVVMNKKKDVKNSVEAFNEFYMRYKNKVWNNCDAVCRKFTKKPIEVDDVFVYVVERIFYKSHTFKSESRDHIEEELQAWYGTIGQNYFYDSLKKFSPKGFDFEDIEERIDIEEEISFIEEDEEEITIEQHKLSQAWETLNEKEIDILLAYLNNTKKRLPDEQMNALCEKWGIKSGSVYRVYQRTLEKLQKLCTE